jgi:hypothetical protein
VSQILLYLIFLACPVSMGVMMWMMMRGDHGRMGVGSSAAGGPDPRIAELESQVAELRAVVRLERPDRDALAARDPSD